MSRRVVFAGGIQAKALAKAYRLDIAADTDEDVFFIGAEALSREAAHRVIAAGDVVVTDLTAAGPSVADYLIPGNAQSIAVPVVRADFLWPFAGRPHPRNRGTDAVPGGPYPADFGDSFLDDMLAQGVSEDEAVARYLTLDVAKEAGLDARLEASLAGLAALDARAGFDLARYVRAEFRTQNLFATIERLRLPLFRHIAAAVFGRMGVAKERVDAVMEANFAPGAMPIHPAVLRHFDMAAPLPGHRYPVLDEGTFTFEHYCRRYYRYEWNERLHAAILLSESSPAEAIPALRLALETSPGSRAGQMALEEAERAVADSSMLAPLVLPPPAPVPEPPAPTLATPLYAAVDAPLPDSQTSETLMPGSQPKAEAAPQAEETDAGVPIIVPSAFGKLPFTSEHDFTPAAFNDPEPAPVANLPVVAPPRNVVLARAPGAPASQRAEEPDSEDPDQPEQFSYEDDASLSDDVPEQQHYIELPTDFSGFTAEPEPAAKSPQNRYMPLAPSADLIEVLPRLLSATRAQRVSEESPFAEMPETMPPPPLRPVLPPELQVEDDEKRGFMGRLFGGRA